MSSPRPASGRLLPSALPHERESPSESPSRTPANMPSRTSYDRESYAAAAAYETADALESSSLPPLQPFFTLIEDSNAQSTIHPSVTYIFADDDQDPITNAAIKIDERPSSARQRPQKRPPDPVLPHQSPGGRRRSVQGSGGGTGQNVPTREPVERCIIVDLGPDGRSITGAQSLTPDWHVDSAELSIAPTLDGDSGLTGAGTSPGGLTSRLRRGVSAAVAGPDQRPEEAASAQLAPEGPLMLKIHGSEVQDPVGHDEALAMGIDGLCETFRDRLNELRRVVEAAEQGSRETD